MQTWYTKKGTVIHRLSTVRCNCYLVQCNHKNILIDTSIKLERKKLMHDLHKLGIYKLHAILLTHAHADHVGNANYLQHAFHCFTYIPYSEGDYLLQGKSPLSKGISKLSHFLFKLSSTIPLYTSFEACSSYQNIYEVSTDLNLTHLKIMATPGHTLGSASIIIDNEIAIVGDAMVHILSHNLFPPFAEDIYRTKTSWLHLLETNCSLFLPAHGKQISKALLEANYRKAIKQ